MQDTRKIIPKEHFAILGQSVEFICLSHLKVKWMFEGRNLPHNSKTGKRISGKLSEEYWLIILGVNYNNYGKYQCISDDDFLVFKDECTLRIARMLQIFQNSKHSKDRFMKMLDISFSECII